MDQTHAVAHVSYDQSQGYEQPLEYHQPPMPGQLSRYGYPGQPNVITTQGNLSYVSPNNVIVTQGERPPNVMFLAIFACVCCFWPTGVCAIMFANQANSVIDNKLAWMKYKASTALSTVSIILGLIWIAVTAWRIMEMKDNSKQYYSKSING